VGYQLLSLVGMFVHSLIWMRLINLWHIYIVYCLLWFRPWFRPRTSNKRFTIQRRLAWSLSKNDTHNRREANLFFDQFDSRSCSFLSNFFVRSRPSFFLTSNRLIHDTTVAAPDNRIVLCGGHWSVAAGNDTSLYS
jgi:hypothetical protein